MSGQFGVDAHDSQGIENSASSLVSNGYTFAAQYIDQDTSTSLGTPVTPGQITADISAGLEIVSIFETNGMAGTGYYSGSLTFGWETYLTAAQGSIDAMEAIASAESLGQTPGSAIYFAMDFNPAQTVNLPNGNTFTESDALATIGSYFQGVDAVFDSATDNPHDYQVGVYGAGDTLKSVYDAGQAQYTWLSESTAWAGSTTDLGPNSGSDSTTYGWTMIQSGSPFADHPSTITSVNVDYDQTASGVSFGDWDTPESVCFCRGTMILTPAGEMPVEQLNVGDMVTTLSGAGRPITWIGSGRSLITGGNERSRPIIVCRSAIADGVPSRDLYVTKGHSIYLDGVLIPVEFLVNGRSVLWDDRAQVVEFYHVELSQHDVLIADGAPAESYKEDGNRDQFHTRAEPVVAAGEKEWFAPVRTGGPEVEQVWRRLSERSGFQRPPLTSDPDLHLVADGRRIEPQAIENGAYRFQLERPPIDLRIVSRSIKPIEIGRNHDPRRLGVAIHSIVLSASGATTTLAYDSPWLSEGFHDAESEPAIRWTNGEALVPNRPFLAFDGPIELTLNMGATVEYPLPTLEASAGEAQAA